ncbi:uncharacterized protein [Amphiura filiformis]|uniref:uncharacterized protein n=1 Tax=Amphiura filiformis TaxID=82378 RepID=UPI003B21EF2F
MTAVNMATTTTYCLVLSFLLFITDTSAILDLTCLSFSPRIQINGDNNHFMGGFTSGNATGAVVNFGRALDTGTGSGLPPGSFTRGHGSTSAKILRLPQAGKLNRVGVFYCEASKEEVVERTNVITLAFSSDITPLQTFQTVSLGESVIFEVEKPLNASKLRWRHNSNDIITEWSGKNAVYIDRVMVSDAGIYECYWDGQRERGEHAIFQLIVRGCAANKWGPPDCLYDCPLCLNGGICDDQSGVCVCAPGFTGSSCEQVLGSNRWGQDGGVMCSRKDGNDPHSRACQGTLFCLPHPYGCSCAARYYGIDCIKGCPDGFYGANCKLECHCPTDVSCLDDTGECNISGGRCMQGWSGNNCQQKCTVIVLILTYTDPGQILDISVTPKGANGFLIDWEPEASPCIQKEYLVEYKLANRDQCETTMAGEIKLAGRVKSTNFTIEGLEYYSTYIFYVTTTLNGTYNGTNSPGVTVSTGEKAPFSAPSDVMATFVTSNSISYQWSEVSCGSRRGEILAYLYFVTDERRQELFSNATTKSLTVTIGKLTPFANYRFEVAAITKEGVGPLSEPIYMTTNQTAPGAPILLTVVKATKYSIGLTWQEPVHPHYIVEKYFVSSKIITKPYDLNFREESEPENGQLIYNRESHTFENLKPTTKYELKVFAYSGNGKGEHSAVYQYTLPATAEDLSTPEQVPVIQSTQITPTTVSITIPRSYSEFVTGYQVGVEWIPGTGRRKRQSEQHYLDPRFHVAGEIPKSTVHKIPEFVIGDNGTYGMFYNGPLLKGQTYKIYTSFISRIDKESYAASWSDGRPVVTSWPGRTPMLVDPVKPTTKEQEKGYNKDQKVIIVLVVIIVLLVIAFVAYGLKTRPPGSMNKVVVRWNRLS